MRSIASCYSEHAVKVSDSYCSGPSHHSYVISKRSPPIPHSISSIYKSKSQTQFPIILNWSNDQIGRGFTIKIGSNSKKITTHKGSETFRFSKSEISIIWDLSEAHYDPGPEPTNGFYLILIIDSEIGLWLGEKREKLAAQLGFPKPKYESQIPKFSLVSRNEQFFGEGSVYASRAKFTEEGRIHDIMIKCGVEEEEGRWKNKNQELLVFIDKKKIFQVNRLRWNFRGNQTIFIDGSVIDMMWDVYEWFFKSESGFGIFMFRTRSGLDSRLWLEEKKEQQRIGFTLLIRACKNAD